MQITNAHAKLVVALRPHTIPWRKMTIALDGVDGSGKSTLGRFLAWQLGMPLVETDMFIRPNPDKYDIDVNRFAALVQSRHSSDRPVLVEGILVLQSLHAIGVTPEVVVRVECAGRSSSWGNWFADYVAEYPRASKPDYTFNWEASD